jgi:hypothetical protein
MNAVAGSRKEKESELVPTSPTGTKWTVEKPKNHLLAEWIEFGHTLRIASEEDILSLISKVETYLGSLQNDETLADAAYGEYVRGCAKTTLRAAQSELRNRGSNRSG